MKNIERFTYIAIILSILVYYKLKNNFVDIWLSYDKNRVTVQVFDGAPCVPVVYQGEIKDNCSKGVRLTVPNYMYWNNKWIRKLQAANSVE